MAFQLEISDRGHARFSDGSVALVRFRPDWQWEFYVITQGGPLRGLEMFVRYLEPEEAARVESALACELSRRRLDSLFRDEPSVPPQRSTAS